MEGLGGAGGRDSEKACCANHRALTAQQRSNWTRTEKRRLTKAAGLPEAGSKFPQREARGRRSRLEGNWKVHILDMQLLRTLLSPRTITQHWGARGRGSSSGRLNPHRTAGGKKKCLIGANAFKPARKRRIFTLPENDTKSGEVARLSQQPLNRNLPSPVTICSCLTVTMTTRCFLQTLPLTLMPP